MPQTRVVKFQTPINSEYRKESSIQFTLSTRHYRAVILRFVVCTDHHVTRTGPLKGTVRTRVYALVDGTFRELHVEDEEGCSDVAAMHNVGLAWLFNYYGARCS